jgi:hypothetical protein
VLVPTHLLAGYVLGHYLCGEGRLADWRHRPAWLGVLGAALPDLLDKPLGTVGVTDLFHSVGHSLGALAALGLVGLAVRRRAPRSRAWTDVRVVWVAWASHLALDALHMVVNGRPADTRFLAWPVVEHTPRVTLPPGQFARFYVGTPAFLLEAGFWLVVGLAVVRSESTTDAAEGS